MTTETATPEKALADVRKEIDAIDDAIQDLLLKRTELVVEVAEAKARPARPRCSGGSPVATRAGCRCAFSSGSGAKSWPR
jgi:hypothetical protein